MHHDEALTEVILKFKLTMILPEVNVVTGTLTFLAKVTLQAEPEYTQIELLAISHY